MPCPFQSPIPITKADPDTSNLPHLSLSPALLRGELEVWSLSYHHGVPSVLFGREAWAFGHNEDTKQGGKGKRQSQELKCFKCLAWAG